MSTTPRISHRAVAASAAFLLSGFAFAGTAVADNDGKGGKGDGKGGGDRGAAASQGRSQGSSKGSSSSAKGDGGKSGAARESKAKGDTGSTRTNGGDPAGNNGTFKVDGLPYSDGMANEPHVSCGFRLEFFGFDDGQTGDITIAGHAPSGSGVVSSRTGVLISDDAAGGGPNDPDAVVEYTAADLNLAGLTAHPQQGYHLKVTFTSDEGVKHKVFWFEPCVTGETGGAGGAGAVGGVGVTQPVGQVSASRSDTAVLGTRFERNAPGAGSGNAEVLGTRFERGAGALPFTGSVAGTLLALGGGLVVVGGGAWMLGRRMRHIA